MKNSASDIFASLLDPVTPAEKKKTAAPAVQPPPVARVTPATIARVRAEQAAEAHQAELARVENEKQALADELATEKEVVEALAADLAQARAETEDVRARAEAEAKDVHARAEAEKATLLAQIADLRQRLETLQRELEDAQRTSLSSSVLLDKPAGFSEKFTGEVREHVLEALADANAAAEAAGRERRARILEAVLCANAPTGELDRRRAELKQILKDAGSSIDNSVIAALTRLGFRYITGRNHHKLEFAGIRFPLAKTPSDHRASLNSAAEIANRAF